MIGEWPFPGRPTDVEEPSRLEEQVLMGRTKYSIQLALHTPLVSLIGHMVNKRCVSFIIGSVIEYDVSYAKV